MNKYTTEFTKKVSHNEFVKLSSSVASYSNNLNCRMFIRALTFGYFPYLELSLVSPHRKHSSSPRISTIFLRLAGKIRIELSAPKYCSICRTKRISEREYLCDSCMETQIGIYLRCVREGFTTVLPNKKYCNSSVLPLCLYPENIGLCSANHILYIGNFGDFMKVGVTRADRKSNSFFLRHIEQGLDFALIFKTDPELSLPEAQRLESKIAEKLEIPKEISFKYKVELLNRPQLRNLEKIYTRLRGEVNTILRAEGYRIVNVIHQDLRKNYIVPQNEAVKPYKMRKKTVEGRVVGFKGNLLFLRDDDNTLFVFNSNLLLNHYVKAFEIENPLEPYRNMVLEV